MALRCGLMCFPALGSFKLAVDLRPDEVQPPSRLLCCSLRKDLVCEALALFAVGSQRYTDLQALIGKKLWDRDVPAQLLRLCS